MTAYEPLHHKYRPQTFAQLVGQEAISTTLTNAIMQQRIAPAYLFTGPRGTGKTSSARIFAKSLNCLNSNQPTPDPCGVCEVCRAIARGSALDVIEIDAASNTGVDNIRELIEKAQFAPVQCRYKVYVIDECHMLSVSAFNALLKTLEEPPRNVVFILATTDSQRVLPTIISRCQRFDYRRIPLDSMADHLQHIATKENINISSQAITLVAQIANGGLRDAESLLDQLSLLSGVVTPERIWDLVGVVAEPDLLALLTSIRSDNPETVISQGRNLMNKGREPLVILQNLANFYLNLLLAKTASNRPDLVAVTAPTWEALCQEAKNWNVTEILQGQKHLKDSELQIKNTTVPRLWLEITLLGLLPSALSKPQIAIETNTSAPAKQSSVNQVNNPIAKATTPQNTPAVTKENIPTKPMESPVSNSVQETEDRNPITGNNYNLEVWERVLERITKHSAKVLFKQQANLISFQNNVAHIGLKNQSLVTIATKDISFIEEAFYSVFQQKITVKLQVTSVANSQNTVSQPPIQPTIQATEPISPRVAEPPAFTPSPKTQDENRSVINNKPPETKDTVVPPQVNIEGKKTDNLENNYSQVTKAAENIAKFFDGEIIVLDDTKAEADKSSEIEEKPANTDKPPLKGRPDITEIDEEDVPF